jgi:hypothetical protein
MFNLFTKIKNLFIKKEESEVEPEEYHMMGDEEFIKFNKAKLFELDPLIVIKSVVVLNELPELLEETRKLYKEDPVHWISPYHFTTGMAMRNLLREKVCRDDQLPSGNWDDVYVQLMEIAAGVREYPNQVRVVKG